jgi:hypothetical protein
MGVGELEPNDDNLMAALADLRGVSIEDLRRKDDDGLLESTLQRVLSEARSPRDAVSGFQSAV